MKLRRSWRVSQSVRLFCCVLLLDWLVILSGCGGDSGGKLTPDEYKAIKETPGVQLEARRQAGFFNKHSKKSGTPKVQTPGR